MFHNSSDQAIQAQWKTDMEPLKEEFLADLRKLIAEGRLMVFDEDTKNLKSIESLSMNGGSIQLNAERFHDDKSND